MCGRYNQRTPLTVLASQLEFDLDAAIPWKPRYNIAPTQAVPIVRLVDGRRQLAMLRWGLVPSWSKDPKPSYSTINARADTVATKPVFRSAYKSRRCLVLADGYYEWEKVGKLKLPWLYEVAGGPFAFAGLWEGDTCTILTTEANALAANFHDRMPVILDPEDYQAWLECEQIPLVPYPAGRMTARPVSTAVNNVKTQGAECVEARQTT
jgi:putative SOS response-associated peptidase YedK